MLSAVLALPVIDEFGFAVAWQTPVTRGPELEGFEMRAILILIVIGLLMLMAGWLTISRNGSQTSITIENQKIERDTGRAIHCGADVLHHPQQGQP